MCLISVREEKKRLLFRTDSKHVVGLWRLSTPGSIDSGNCLYEKTNRAYESLLQLAASIIIFRKLGII